MAMNPTPYSETSNTHGYSSYIKEITLPSGNKYEIVDEAAREKINTLGQSTQFIGVVSSATPITDGSTTSVITIGGSSVTAHTGDIVIQQTGSSTAGMIAQEYIFDGSKWQLFGDISTNNLGALAFKSSGQYSKISEIKYGSSAVTASGSYTPSGGVELTKAEQTIAISSTNVDPGSGNTANYWIYKPSGTVSVTYTTVNASANFVQKLTAAAVVTGISTTAPTSATVTNGLSYANVDDHTLLLNYLVVPTETLASTRAYISTKTAKTTTCSFTGNDEYIKPLSVTVTTAATFSGTQGTVTVNSGTNKFVTSVSATCANTAVTFS